MLHSSRRRSRFGPVIARESSPRRSLAEPTPIERHLTQTFKATCACTFLGAVLAVLVLALGYIWGGNAPLPLDVNDALEWVERVQSGWDPLAVLSLLAAVVLPLFLATQLGNAIAASATVERAAHHIRLEQITGASCLLATIASWMVVPAACFGDGALTANVLVAFAAPLLFASLFAVAVPSSDAALLDDAKSEVRRAHVERLRAEFSALLPLAPQPGEGSKRQWSALLRPFVIDGARSACLAGVCFAVVTWRGPEPAVVYGVTVTVLFFVMYALVALIVTDHWVTSLLEERWARLLRRATHGCVGLSLGASLLAFASHGWWNEALVLAVATVGPAALVRRRSRSAAFHAIVYGSLLRRTAGFSSEKEPTPGV